MTADTVHRTSARSRIRGRRGGFFLLPVAALAALLAAAAGFIAYVLWPTWPGAPVALDAPAIPMTVAGVLFDVPPAAIRIALQRHSGPHERVDLVFLWPSLTPPLPADTTTAKPGMQAQEERPSAAAAAAPPSASDRLFVTIAALGNVLPPKERLRTIYPRYAEPRATAGTDGLAVLHFRAGSPYEGEDLIYVAETPERFFARCTRDAGAVRGMCLHDRALDTAELTLRFPRRWLDDWRGVAAGFDRLVARLHPQGN